MVVDSCKFFDVMTAKYTLKPTGKRKHRRDSMMSKTEVMLVMIPFHGSGYRCFIETVNDELKNIRRWNTPYIDTLTASSSTYYRQLPPISCFQRSRLSMHKASFTLPLHRSESVELTLNR